MSISTQIFLSGDRNRLAESVPTAARRLDGDVPWSRALVRLADDPTRANARASSSAPAFEAVLELATHDAGTITDAVRDLDGADLQHSAVVAGETYPLLARQPDARLALVLALRRQPHLSTLECQTYWREQHAPLALSIPGLAGYQQLHTDISLSGDLAADGNIGLSDFDGAAEVSFVSLAEFAEVMAQPDIAGRALEDERKFLDHSRSALGLYDIAYVTAA